MPEFLLRYKTREDLKTLESIKEFRQRVRHMATQVQKVTEEIFDLDVVWEIRGFGDSQGMPNFYVTAWVTDNDETKGGKILRAQAAIQTLLESYALDSETVGCWFMGVKGKWGEGQGKLLAGGVI